MRVFYSLHLPERAAEMILRDISSKFDIVPYPKDNLHVTLRFIGEIEESKLPDLYRIGEETAARYPAISFTAQNMNAERNGRLKLELTSESALYELHADLDEALENAGVQLKPQVFSPHVTLGRFTGGIDLSKLTPQDFMRYRFTLHEFGLYKSEPGEDSMGRYQLLKEFPLLGN